MCKLDSKLFWSKKNIKQIAEEINIFFSLSSLLSFAGVIPSYCRKEGYNKENLFNSLNCDIAAKKRKKDQMNNKTRIQCKALAGEGSQN